MHDRRRTLRRAGPGLALLVLAACGGDPPLLPPEPVPDALSVSFLLQRGGLPPRFPDRQGEQTPPTRVFGFIGQVSDPTARYLDYVFDAAATINGTPLDVRPREWYDGTSATLERQYNYFTDSLALQPGATYTLAVDRGGKRLVAATRMPGEFGLRSINGGAGKSAVPPGEPLVLAWSRAEGAVLYAVSVEEPAPGTLGFDSQFPVLTRDTTLTLPFATSRSGSIPVIVEIQAMDPNLYRASIHRDTRAGIEGGFGFFGSAHVKRYRVDLQISR